MKLIKDIILYLITIVASVTPLFAAVASTTSAQQPERAPYSRGRGNFTFTEYEPLKEKPIQVYYYVPKKGDITKMRVLFAMHGAQRTSSPAIRAWRYFAEREGFIVIAPQYSKKFYREWEYQFGGVAHKGKVQPCEKWTYNSIEAIFDHFKKITGSTAEVYDMFGQSAGGQFTHRFALAMPKARLNIAVAANPGSWTFPLVNGLPSKTIDGKTYSYPYSVKGTPMANDEVLKRFFSCKLYIQIGKNDVATSGKYVPTKDNALSQGKHRLDRARNMYKVSKKLAKKNKWEFNWEKVEVKGVGHGTMGMVYGKYTEDANGKKRYSIDDYTKTSAYYLLFEKDEQARKR